jgi:hypothetical protein
VEDDEVTRVFRPQPDDGCVRPGHPPEEEVTRALNAREVQILARERFTPVSKGVADDPNAEPGSTAAAGRPNHPSGLNDGVTVAYRSPPQEITRRKSRKLPAASLPAPTADAACEAESPSIRFAAPPSQDERAETEFARHRRRRRIIAWTSGALLLCAAGSTLSQAGQRGLGPTTIRDVAQQMAQVAYSLRSSPAAAPDKIAPPLSAPSSTLVALSISVTPTHARVSLDGQPIGNPTVLDRAPDRRPHELRAEAPGYRTLTRTIRLERDVTVILELAPSSSGR